MCDSVHSGIIIHRSKKWWKILKKVIHSFLLSNPGVLDFGSLPVGGQPGKSKKAFYKCHPVGIGLMSSVQLIIGNRGFLMIRINKFVNTRYHRQQKIGKRLSENMKQSNLISICNLLTLLYLNFPERFTCLKWRSNSSLGIYMLPLLTFLLVISRLRIKGIL